MFDACERFRRVAMLRGFAGAFQPFCSDDRVVSGARFAALATAAYSSDACALTDTRPRGVETYFDSASLIDPPRGPFTSSSQTMTRVYGA